MTGGGGGGGESISNSEALHTCTYNDDSNGDLYYVLIYTNI